MGAPPEALFSESSLYGNSGWNFIYADEIDMSELPFHHHPDHCSGYPYDIPEFDDEFALSGSYLHDLDTPALRLSGTVTRLIPPKYS